jgi:phenylacetic acid degradation operon negative regulatory protein
MALSDFFTDFIQNRSKVANISSKSHLVTVFGDVMSQHGDWIWLGSLISALQPLGFSDRLIRTSVFRLVQDDWLQTRKVGRRSYYSFTESAKRHYEKAARRIYAGDVEPWDGSWLIVIPVFVGDDKLVSFRRQLNWLGFSPLASGVYAHPSFDKQSLEETIEEMALNDAVVIFTSKTLDDSSNDVLKHLVHDRWNIQSLEDGYQRFLTSYEPLQRQLERAAIEETPISTQQSFLIRTLLIHEYRRMLLKDHELPADMLPNAWAGFAAHALVSELYGMLASSSNLYITSSLENAEGILAQENVAFWSRFKNN